MEKVFYPKKPEFINVVLKKDKHLYAWSGAMGNLMKNGLTFDEAEKALEQGIELELVYENETGLFAIESECISCCQSPYTGKPLAEQDLFAEVRNDYHDDESHYTTIDAWETGDDDEEGKVVAVVHDSGDVFFVDNGARSSQNVLDAIREVQERLKNGNTDTNNGKA